MHCGEHLNGKSCFQIGSYTDSSFFSELLEPIKKKQKQEQSMNQNENITFEPQ
jgi:hypothetical protein